MRLAVVAVCIFAGAGHAADPLTVVLRCQPHASLTPAFRQDLQTRLQSSLGGSVGPAVVRLFDDRPGEPVSPFWRQAFARGLDRMELSTAAPPSKTHFVDVRIVG